MFNGFLKIPKTKPQSFQILFLRNDHNQEVEVHEVEEVDFITIQERLEQGESIFITTKESQKIKIKPAKNKVSKTVTATSYRLENIE